MRHARLLIYEGDKEWLERTLAKSLKEGQNEIGPERYISVKALDTTVFDEITEVFPMEEKRGSASTYTEVDNG